MRNSLRTLLVSAMLLVGCGGGSGGGTPFVNNNAPQGDGASSGGYSPGSSVVNACEAPYFSELIGAYDAQITYVEQYQGVPFPDGDQCTWEASIEVKGSYGADTTYRQICFLTTSIKSEILASGPSNRSECANIDGVGPTIVPFNTALNSEFWVNPVWPIDTAIWLQADLPAGKLYPVGTRTGSNGQRDVKLRFDGVGNITFQQSSDSAAWDGVFVKQ